MATPEALAAAFSGAIADYMNIENYLVLARSAARAYNHQEAHKYWTLVLEGDPKNVEAWVGKGTAAGWLSQFSYEGIKEAKASFDEAIGLGLTDADIRIAAASSAYTLAQGYFEGARKEHLNLFRLQGSNKLKRRTFLEATTLTTGLPFLEMAWQLEKSTDRAKTVIEICDSYRSEFAKHTGEAFVGLAKQCEDWVKMNDPDALANLTKPSAKKGCFVATATFGNSEHPQVRLLQEFRDTWLLKRCGGPLFVRMYYRFGPSIARVIENSAALQLLSRVLLIYPAYCISRRLLKRRT